MKQVSDPIAFSRLGQKKNVPQRSPRLCGNPDFEKKSMYFLLCDQIPIQASVLNRFGEMGGLDVFLAFEVGNGSSHL